MVRRLSGITFSMPASYGQRIKAVPGVVAVTPMNWFGAYWKDPANTFANFAIDPNSVFDVLDTARIAPDQLEAFKRERVAAVAGRRLIEKFNWKIGDRITLMGSPYPVTPELVLRGTFTGGADDQFYFHYDYLNEAMGEFNRVGLYWIRVERPEIAARVGQAIDQTFRDTDSETKTEAEGTFLLGFISMLGNVRCPAHCCQLRGDVDPGTSDGSGHNAQPGIHFASYFGSFRGRIVDTDGGRGAGWSGRSQIAL
jgi:putative ABC transport system permease protein